MTAEPEKGGREHAEKIGRMMRTRMYATIGKQVRGLRLEEIDVVWDNTYEEYLIIIRKVQTILTMQTLAQDGWHAAAEFFIGALTK